jgi:flagellar biosynthesis/type III secretory pathway M-ring protein FliF/YscJ
VPRKTVSALRRTVTTAAGLNRQRGDTLSVARVKTPAPPSVPPPGFVGWLVTPLAQTVLSVGRWVVLGAGFLIFPGGARTRARDDDQDGRDGQ